MADEKISELTDAVSLHATDELVVARSGDNYRLSGTELSAGFDAAGAAAAAQAASQPLDADLTAIAALDSSTSGAIASDGAGWVKKTYAQFKTALGLSTADVPDSTDKRYVTDAELVVIGNTSGTNTGDQTSVSGNAGTATKLATARNINGVSFDGTADITNIAEATHAATSKTTPLDADELALVDTAASNVLKKLTGTNLKAYLKTYFDTLYQATGSVSSVFGRTGAVVAATNDYTAAQVTDAADKSSASAQNFTGGLQSAVTIRSIAPTLPIGYGVGAGGTASVTQANAFSPGVTINRNSGQITVTSLSLANSANMTVKLTNSSAGTTDILIVNIEGADAGTCLTSGSVFAAGTCYILVRNVSGSTVSSDMVLTWALIHAVTT